MYRQAAAKDEAPGAVAREQMACAWQGMASLAKMTAQVAAMYEHVADTHAEVLHEGADLRACPRLPPPRRGCAPCR